MFPHLSRRAILFGMPAVFVATTTAAGLFSRSVPKKLDLALKKQTLAGLYSASIKPEHEPVVVGRMHAWVLTLADSSGKPIKKAAIGIKGGMPQHGHGLPTAPTVTRSFGDGRFLIEGIKFNMQGWWTINLSIDGSPGVDTVTFNIVL
ncbi:FixH family protein [Rhizobium sp. KVB221]|uniref:FixH family protein n=1 Tax=Rhizobium setariae TaxID=2801340 RepID=A0A937CLS5_9HYPH|nr:FixH family protein [Rhizobium setariae]MBL0373490.1 FixH family protein [Rhizobium setariae]